MPLLTLKEYLSEHPGVVSYETLKRRCRKNPRRYGAEKRGHMWFIDSKAVVFRERRHKDQP